MSRFSIVARSCAMMRSTHWHWSRSMSPSASFLTSYAIISSSSASAPVELLGGAGLRQVDELDEPQAAFVAPRKPLFKAIQPATGTRTAEIMSASQE